MLKRQMALRLSAETETEADAVWRSLPPSSRREIAQLHARLVGRAAKSAAPTKEQDETQQ